MSIFNWRRKKDEEQKKQVMEPKQQTVALASVHTPDDKQAPKTSKHATLDARENIDEKARSTGDAYRVLVRPLITEKNTLHQSENQYVFEVSPRANKIEIRKAVESVFKVKVTRVHIASYRGKVKQFGRIQGTRKKWKKAIVTVGKGDKIALLSSV